MLQIVHRCDSGLRTVRLAHQITMAGDKVLSGDCRFARRNYFPDARKEIVACVTMARSLRPTVPRHGDAQRVSPRHFSPAAVAATAFFFTPSPSAVRFAGVLLRRFFSAVVTLLSCRFEARQSWSPPLGESWRASFNEKLISRVKSSTVSEERDLFFLLALVLRRLGFCCIFIQPLFPFSPLI